MKMRKKKEYEEKIRIKIKKMTDERQENNNKSKAQRIKTKEGQKFRSASSLVQTSHAGSRGSAFRCAIHVLCMLCRLLRTKKQPKDKAFRTDVPQTFIERAQNGYPQKGYPWNLDKTKTLQTVILRVAILSDFSARRLSQNFGAKLKQKSAQVRAVFSWKFAGTE